jgi:hypothetical protein
MKYLAYVGVVLAFILFRVCDRDAASMNRGVSGVNASRVEISYRRVRYSEASDRYIDFGYDYDKRQIVVYIPTVDRWKREKPAWAKERRAEIVGEVKRICDAKMTPKPIYEEY